MLALLRSWFRGYGRPAVSSAVVAGILAVIGVLVVLAAYGWIGGASPRYLPDSPLYEALRIEGARLALTPQGARVTLYLANAGNTPVNVVEVIVVDSVSGYVVCGYSKLSATLQPHTATTITLNMPRSMCDLRRGGVYVVEALTDDGVEAAYVVSIP